jgi:hypothetical protein
VRRTVAAVGAALALAGAALALGACGDDANRTATVVGDSSTAPPAASGSQSTTVPATTTPPPSSSTATATTPSAPPAGTNPTATTGVPPSGGAPDTGGTSADSEQAPGGAGDEEGARVPATFTLAGGAISPAWVTVPAFLAVEIALTAEDGAQKVTIAAPGGGTVDVAPGTTARRSLSGLKPGDYTVATAGGAKATLHVVSGGDPGP